MQKRLISSLTGSLLLALALSQILTAETSSVPWNRSFDGGRALKALDHVVATWDLNSSTADNPQVEVFNQNGERIQQLRVLQAVPQAESVGIWDLSVDPAGGVAVAAVFARPGCQRESVLLLYAPEGGLRDAIRLGNGRAITRLEYDDDGSLWALGHHSGTLDPAEASMLFHYDSHGNELGAYVSRDQFPQDAEFTEEGPDAHGAPGLGVTATQVWFWLPASQRLATINKDGSGLAIYTTGLPVGSLPESGADELHTEVSRVGMLPSGALLAEARTSSALAVVSAGLFQWTHAGGWTKVEDPRLPVGAQMLNATRSGEILLRQYDTDPTRVLLGRTSLD
ncbi:MAG: hypothetical protein H6509_11760 [Bryobacterales bacterium]|nr:hypothetical protein [Acidobacteriota bacterium]MCB9385283.1 hypothetical protein [Bryobacterales bacterium]